MLLLNSHFYPIFNYTLQVFRRLTEGKDIARRIDAAVLRKEDKALIEDENAEQAAPEAFKYSHGLTEVEAAELLRKWGRNELPEKVIPKWYIFVSQLWQPMPIMIWIAAIVEAGIQNYIDMAILLFIQFANASIGYYEITKAGDAVAALKKSLKPEATVKRDGEWKKIDAAFVVPGN